MLFRCSGSISFALGFLALQSCGSHDTQVKSEVQSFGAPERTVYLVDASVAQTANFMASTMGINEQSSQTAKCQMERVNTNTLVFLLFI
jgi:hypothetical protein